MCFGGGGADIKPTADQIAQQQTNAKLWNYYNESYKPVIQKYAAQTTSPANQKLESNQVAGQINAEVMKNLTPQGASSNPVANAKQIAGLTQMKTTAEQTGAANVAKKQAGDVQNIVNIGRGQATDASKDLGSLAEQSVQSEIQTKELSMQENATMDNAIGSTIGAAGAGAMAGLKKPKSLGPQTIDELNQPDNWGLDQPGN